LTIERIKKLVQQLYEQLDEKNKLRIIAGDELRIEIIEDSEGELTEENQKAILDELRSIIFEKEAPQAYLRLDGGLWRDTYAIFGDLDDNEAIWDNLEAFDVNILLCKFKNKVFSMEDCPINCNAGFFFIQIPKWEREAAKNALENYARRIDWKNPGIKQLGQEAVAQIKLVKL